MPNAKKEKAVRDMLPGGFFFQTRIRIHNSQEKLRSASKKKASLLGKALSSNQSEKESDVFDDLAALETAGTNLDGFHGALDLGFHFEEIGKPCSSGAVLCVGYSISKHRAFAADFTFS